MKRRTAFLILSVLGIFALTPGCLPEIESECRSSADCSGSDFCQMGLCSDPHDNHPEGKSMLGADDDTAKTGDVGYDYESDTDADQPPDEPPHPCPDAPPADADSLLLNEFMANVPTGPDGDSNQDGVRHYHDDEFVELVNISDETIDLTDVAILKASDPRFILPPACLEPMHALVVFGALEDGADPPSGEGFESLISDKWFIYAQDSGHVVVRDADDGVIADHTYGSHPSGSLNLDADLDGDAYMAHRDLSDEDTLFSPGTCANGQPFPTGCDEDGGDVDDESDRSDPEPTADE